MKEVVLEDAPIIHDCCKRCFLPLVTASCAFWGFLAVTVHEHKLTLTFSIPFIDFDILSPLKQLDQKRIHLMCNDETKAAGCVDLKEH